MATFKEWLKKLYEFLLDICNRLERMVGSLLGVEKTTTTPTPAPKTPAPTPAEAPDPFTVERHKVAGINYHTEELLSLGTENEDYDLSRKQLIEEGMTDERVYMMDFGLYPCELIPEPTNPADPKAIKVAVRGEHIGYIKHGSCSHVHNLLGGGRIESISCDIGGGAYKIVQTDYDEDGNESYTLEKDTAPYHATVVIKVKKEEEKTV